MKIAIKAFITVIVILYCIRIVSVIEAKSVRKNELERGVSNAMCSCLDEMMSDADYLALDGSTPQATIDSLNARLASNFTKYLLIQLKSDSNADVTVIVADCESGIMTVEVSLTFKYSTGDAGNVKFRKTGIVDEVTS